MASTGETVVLSGITRTGPSQTTVIETPLHEPNVVTALMTPIRSVLIRSVRAFLQGVAGAMGLSGAGGVIHSNLLQHITAREVILIGLSSAAACAILNGIELFNKLDERYPMFRG